jgi:hypothetical protein
MNQKNVPVDEYEILNFDQLRETIIQLKEISEDKIDKLLYQLMENTLNNDSLSNIVKQIELCAGPFCEKNLKKLLASFTLKLMIQNFKQYDNLISNFTTDIIEVKQI